MSEVWHRTVGPTEQNASKAQKAFEDYQANVGQRTCEPTRLVSAQRIANDLVVQTVLVKDEGSRCGEKAFKILGVEFAVSTVCEKQKARQTMCTMSDGNHGRALASVCRRRGLECVVYVPSNMVAARRSAIEECGAVVVVTDGTYDEAVTRVRRDAEVNGWMLISDQAWPGYTEIPSMIVSGYGTIFREVEWQHAAMRMAPITHVVIQAGVGGLAGAAAAWLHWRREASPAWTPSVRLIVVEPTDAAALWANVDEDASTLKPCEGTIDSVMAGLNCGVPNYVTWPLVRRTATDFVAIGDDWADAAMRAMADEGIVAGESGAAGLGGAMAIQSRLPSDAVVLVINTESDTDPERYRSVIAGKTRPATPSVRER